MSYSEPYAPPPVMRPAKRKNTVLIVAVVLLVIFLTVGGCVALFLGGSKAVESAKVPADRFLTLIEKRKYADARQMLSTQTEQTTTPETVSDVLAVLEKRRGKAVSHSGPQSFNVNSFNGVTQVRLGYREKFAGGSETPVTLILTPEKDTWKVYSFNFSL